MGKTNRAALELNHISKTYTLGKVQIKALRQIEARIEYGEFVGLVGPSGSGKTTLLNIVGCLDRPTTGTILLDGKNISQLAARQLPDIRNRMIGFIFQSFNLIPVLTAEENVELPLMLQSLTRKERRERVLALLEQVGLRDVIGHRPEEMSGGQQQRVAIARALITRPKIVLADEPTGNLDSETGGSILDILVAMNEQHGITFLLATHDPAVMERTQHLIQLKDGRIIS